MIKISPSNFSCTPESEMVAALLQSSLDRVDPYQAVVSFFYKNGDFLELRDERIPFDSFGKIILLSIGKASISMANAAMEHLGKKISSGVVVYKNAESRIAFPKEVGIRMVQGDHPIPGKNSFLAGKAVLNLLKQVQPSDLLLVLVSGGGSALLAAPVEGASLEGIQKLTQGLIASGAKIQEMNIVRKHLDRLKGGGLLRLTNHAKVLSLIVSDVIDNDISSIASGITTSDDSTFAQAIHILEKYHLKNAIDPALLEYLSQGKTNHHDETLKRGDPRLLNVNNQIILSNSQSILAGEETAHKMGWMVVSGKKAYTGEARDVGKEMAKILLKMVREKKQNSRPAVAINGGEPTVHLKGKGKGGRNLELALSTVEFLDGTRNVAIISFSTDGEDGPTDAAGAIVTGETAEKARQMGLDPKDFLAENDSYHFFVKVGGLIKTGPTGTNVNDLVFLIVL